MSKVIRVVLALCLLLVGVMPLGGCSLMGIRTLVSVGQIDRAIYPDDFDMALARQKGLDTVSSYKQVQDNYFALLSTYLCGLYDFSAADALLDSEGFKPIEEGDYYYNRSLLGSKYFYLRNNIHVERLSVEQIAYLKSDSLAPDDPQGIQIVKDTCEEVLLVHYLWVNGDYYEVSYKRGSSEPTIPNTAIVFFVDYENLYRDTTDTQEYLAGRKGAATTVDGLSREIKAALQPEFGVEILVKDQQWDLYL